MKRAEGREKKGGKETLGLEENTETRSGQRFEETREPEHADHGEDGWVCVDEGL